jgi:hypothetical protein
MHEPERTYMNDWDQAEALLRSRLSPESMEKLAAILDSARTAGRLPAPRQLRRLSALLEAAGSYGEAWRESLVLARLEAGAGYDASGAGYESPAKAIQR